MRTDGNERRTGEPRWAGASEDIWWPGGEWHLSDSARESGEGEGEVRSGRRWRKIDGQTLQMKGE